MTAPPTGVADGRTRQPERKPDPARWEVALRFIPVRAHRAG